MNSSNSIHFDKQMKFALLLLIAVIKPHSQPMSNATTCFSTGNRAVSIYLKDGNILHCDSSVLNVHRTTVDSISLCGHHYHSSETDSILVDNIKGIPFQNRWVFEKRRGCISLYTDNPSKSDNKITFISKNDSICPYSLMSLRKFVGDDPRSHSLVEYELFADILTCIPVALGVGYGIYHIFHITYNSGQGHAAHGLEIPLSYFVFGAALSLPCYLTRNNAAKAITDYNSSHYNQTR